MDPSVKTSLRSLQGRLQQNNDALERIVLLAKQKHVLRYPIPSAPRQPTPTFPQQVDASPAWPHTDASHKQPVSRSEAATLVTAVDGRLTGATPEATSAAAAEQAQNLKHPDGGVGETG
ncbi:unnamed protein product [Vitrella brassicaformis CCMP3155]|uniref:Uncharacterized protein n=2 Tax=Vitrella brassicaformis TaxID=1169539 RepID=A0A0G4GDP3_VITBC|nr:unnamed protein product [Vitrella brassicaformis CCMP3155]|eukprot:CEM27128.1 unnamed protein product [Vitrella brassicaformis CCMP3155]